MNLQEVKEELKKVEIEDLWSAIKGYFLGSMQCIMENSDDPNVKLILPLDLDSLIYDLEDQVSEFIDNYDGYSIEYNNLDCDGDICL